MVVLAVLIGIGAGVAEYFLLRSFVTTVLSGNANKAMLLIPAKLVVMGAALGVVAWQCPEFLWITGICMAAVIIAGAVINAVSGKKRR